MRLRSSTKPSVEGTIAGWNAAAADLSLFQMMAIAAEIGCPLPASLRDYLHNKTQILRTKKKALYMWLANSAAGLFLTAGSNIAWGLRNNIFCSWHKIVFLWRIMWIPLIRGAHLSEKVEQVWLAGAVNSFKFWIAEWHFQRGNLDFALERASFNWKSSIFISKSHKITYKVGKKKKQYSQFRSLFHSWVRPHHRAIKTLPPHQKKKCLNKVECFSSNRYFQTINQYSKAE